MDQPGRRRQNYPRRDQIVLNYDQATIGNRRLIELSFGDAISIVFIRIFWYLPRQVPGKSLASHSLVHVRGGSPSFSVLAKTHA